MDRHGIELSIVSSFTPPDLSLEKGNISIELVAKECPHRFRAAARVDPRELGHQKSLRKFLNKRVFAGISLNPFEQAFKINDSLASGVFEVAEEFGCPVLIESGYPVVSLPFQVAEVAKDYKKVKMVMTHSGQLLASGQSESDALYAIQENRNLYCDTSQIILSGLGGFVEQIVHANKNGSGRRAVFGSNSPLGDLSVELLRIQKANISEGEKDLVFSKNARKLFGI